MALAVNFKRLAESSSRGTACAKKINRIAYKVSGCGNALEGCGDDAAQIKRELDVLSGALLSLSGDVENYFLTLEKVIGKYREAEARICSGKLQKESGRKGAAAAKAGNSEYSKDGNTHSGKKPASSADTDGGQERTRTAHEKDKENARSISGSARKILLAAGIPDAVIDAWEAAGLAISAKEAQAQLPVLLTLAAGKRYPSQAEFQKAAAEAAGDAPATSGGGSAANFGTQAAYLNAVTGVLLSCYPNIALTMDRTVEVPVAPGVTAWCAVSGTGKSASASPVKVSETLDAHSKALKEGISISSDQGSIKYTAQGSSITLKTGAGDFTADNKSAAWSVGGKISEDTSLEVKVKVNYETGETSCEESLTTQVEKAQVTTTMGVKMKPEQSGPQPYPGYEKDMQLQKNMIELHNLILEGMAPDLLTGVETVAGVLPGSVPAVQTIVR